MSSPHVILIPWFRGAQTWRVTAVCLFVTLGFSVLATITSGQVAIACAGLAGGGVLASVYSAVAQLMNSTVIELGEATLEARPRPLPWPGALSIERARVRRLELVRIDGGVCHLVACMVDGSQRVLAADLPPDDGERAWLEASAAFGHGA